VPQDFRNKVIKQHVSRRMIGLIGNLEMFTIIEKIDVPTIEGKTKIPLLVIICGSIDFMI